MMYYKHTQRGYLILFVLVAVAMFFGIILTQTGFNLPVIFLMALIIFLLMSFSSLTTTIDDTHLRIKFGYGIFKKRFALKEIVSVRIVKNRWYYGWGIRIWFWPLMWIYNISGFDAVEIKMKSKRLYRIGTDEPFKLRRAIQKSIKKR